MNDSIPHTHGERRTDRGVMFHIDNYDSGENAWRLKDDGRQVYCPYCENYGLVLLDMDSLSAEWLEEHGNGLEWAAPCPACTLGKDARDGASYWAAADPAEYTWNGGIHLGRFFCVDCKCWVDPPHDRSFCRTGPTSEQLAAREAVQAAMPTLLDEVL